MNTHCWLKKYSNKINRDYYVILIPVILNGKSTVAFRSTKIGNVLKENMNDIQ